ncbi:MAG: hypothetical protein M3Z05_14525 [Gemmatimonadota bacterium]|nr:hypothetical protein [Gemmatimonadota bacterium]
MTNSQQAAPQAGPAKAAQLPKGAELRDQIKQSILAAQDAAREAALNEAVATAPRGARTIRIVDGQLGGSPGYVYGTGSSHGPNDAIPPQVVDISIAFFIMCAVMVIGWPLARAFGKRLERRGDAPMVNAGSTDQLHRIEQAVEAMAIEVERISESQRFLAKLQNAQAPSRELKSS